MSNAFRTLLRKIGSGTHTGKNLTREEARDATCMILTQEATPAQIGAFMIAHRIKRPTSEEMAGMLDAYDRLGPQLEPIDFDLPVAILGSPYDGRSRTAPISPLTALILAASNCPTIMHGGDRMPTKEGVPLIDIWQALGVQWSQLSLTKVRNVLAETSLGFIYLPKHFPLAHDIVTYRDQIGKRPPFATLELMWSPYQGKSHSVCGFVHPPTEIVMREAFAMRGVELFTTVKGSEGSCDLPRGRVAIVGFGCDRAIFAARDYGFTSNEVPLSPTEQLVTDIMAVLEGKPTELSNSAIWNGGFYLYRFGLCADIKEGIAIATELLNNGKVLQKLQQIQRAVSLQADMVIT
ncbi:anthranilate phosphoribosyltransferase family protein [Pseudanabaena sp. PCC 6802]|uniref:anthranilate phosphoribosyltransferase family protein n=1 Tax=Pseudanabaena sp. PCC 6802 TaxID=118173 RepID=UPI00034C5ADB|nr:anthranilate phosphoribosyltransferase family protein [Pseudanabaena sp. PCC 6802]